MHYNCEEIAGIVDGRLLGKKSSSHIKQLVFDSRSSSFSKDSLFFAFHGKRLDGHDFINDLYQNNISHFVIDQNIDIKQYPKASFIKVNDTLTALQALTKRHRKQFDIPVIGITGSNGKTIVKEWLHQLLKDDYHIVRNPKSYNSQIGVPISVWQMDDTHTLGIFEAGISQPDEMSKLKETIQPTIGLMTNIGPAHDKGFLNVRQKVNEKLQLFSNVDVLIYCKDYQDINESIANIRSQGKILNIFSWSEKGDADLKINEVSKKGQTTTIDTLFKDKILSIKIPFSDDASIENAIHCLAVLLYLGYEEKTIQSNFEKLTSVAMRLELKHGIHNCSIINDTYNSDTGSLSIALDFLSQQKQHPKKTLILSDILQTGEAPDKLYNKVAELLKHKDVKRFVGIGEALYQQKKQFKGNGLETAFYRSTNEFLKKASPAKFKNETILLKGARAFEFEKISRLLEEKMHTTTLEIDLNALIHNLNYYRSKINSSTKVMAMVKAFSYGSGSFEIANLLQHNKVDYLAVAYTDEGITLREKGISIPIIVMNPEADNFETMINYQLEPEIYSLTLLDQFKKIIAHNLDTEPCPIHIKLDTGMHRLGFVEEDVDELINQLRQDKNIKIASVFSHLAGSDNAEHDNFTKDQIQSFEKASEKIIKSFKYKIPRHILNSSGILRFPKSQYEMVRLGIGLYGIDTTGKAQRNLENVGTLKSVIAQIKLINKGETIGYNRKGLAKEEMKIGIMNIGYADGLNRELGNGNCTVYINGKSTPIIGDICMDMCFIDLTNIAAKEGDEVIVFGKEQPIQEIAIKLNTIPYEILTSISQRVKRIYLYE